MKNITLILTLFTAAVLSTSAESPKTQVLREIQADRTESPVRIDGILEEDIWQREGYSRFLQSDPMDGEPATEKTVIWIAYDTDNLYIAARLYDTHPEQIIGRLGRRDDEVDSDWFTFCVDPYHDLRSGFQFAVNPSGSIIDGTLFNDEGKDLTWDGVWESAARIDDSGWAVEMRIPYHQLRFKEEDSYTWGVNFFRVIKRKNEKACFSWIPKEESGYVSRFASLSGIRNIKPGRFIEFQPFAVGKAGFSPKEPGNPFSAGEKFWGNAGFDFKSGLKSNLTLNLTVNPDFGQVEVDPAIINISDQETYYAEKRPFFIEGADIFRFGTGGANTARNLGWRNPAFFYSRRIGRSPQGFAGSGDFVDTPDWTTILSAAKITGKLGDGWNVGLLSALTEREYSTVAGESGQWKQEAEPFSYYGILRTQKEFSGGFRGLGFITTAVLRDLKAPELSDRLTRSALSLAVDGWTFLDDSRKWVVSGWLGGTRITGSETAITGIQRSSLHYFQRPDIDYVEVDESATSLNGWAGRFFINKQKGNIVFNAALGAISPGFHAMDAGYHARGDAVTGHIETGYQVFHPGKVFRNWRLTLSTLRSYDFGGERVNEQYDFTALGQFLNYWTGTLFLSYDPVRYNHLLTRGGPVMLYPWGATIQPSFSSDNRKPLVVTLSAHYRDHPYGAWNYSFDIGLRWKPRPNFSMSISPGYSWRRSVATWVTRIPDSLKTETYGARYILSDIIQETFPVEIRINWTFTPRLSLQAYLQPFIGAGDYQKFKEFMTPRTFDFLFYGENGSTIELIGDRYYVDPDGPGPAREFSFRNLDFSLKSLRGTIVLRWEYRPGSLLYFVWTQNRADTSHPGDFNFSRDFGDIFNAPGDNIFLLKINYRFKF